MSVRAGALGGRWVGALGWRVRWAGGCGGWRVRRLGGCAGLAGAEAGVTTSIVRSSSA